MPQKLSILLISGTSFGINFLSISQIPPNSYFATNIMRTLCFYNFRPLILASKINKKTHVFYNPFLGPHFSHLFSFCLRTVDLGTPFKSSRRQNETQNRPSGATLPKISMFYFRRWRVFSRPAFPKTIIIIVPFAPSDFLDEDELSFCFFSFPVC